MVGIISYAVVIIVFVAALVLFFLSGYTKAKPDEAIVISGMRSKPRFLIGKAGFRIPFLERKDFISLKLIPIDVKTSSDVPTADYINIRVDSVVNVKVSPNKIYKKYDGSDVVSEDRFLDLAAQNFLNKDEKVIAAIAREVLEGNMREIVGKMSLQDMVKDRQKFAELVRENAGPDLGAMGLEIVSFNVQNFVDKDGVIDNLGIDNIVRIKKDAAISRAQAERDIAIAQAEAKSASNDSQVKSEQEIAERNNNLEIRRAELKAESDLKKAEADAAYAIKQAEQNKTLEAKKVEAAIAKTEQEVTLNAKRAEAMEQSLDAEVKKKAEAQKFADQQRADAELYRRQRDADAKKYELSQEAEIKKIEALAAAEAVKASADATKYQYTTEAEGIKAKGEAEAAAIRAKAEAEAAGTLAKAEAMKQYGEAAKQEMTLKTLEVFYNQLPSIAEAIAEPLSKVDHITMYGDGNASKFMQDMITGINQITDGLSSGLGVDLKSVVSSAVSGKVAGKKIAKAIEDISK